MDTTGKNPKDASTPAEETPKGHGGADARAKMRQTIAAARHGAEGRDELMAAARALVGELRHSQQPPEVVLVQIKEILAEVGLRPSYATPEEGTVIDQDALLYRDVIAASIKSYYEQDGV